MTPNKQAQPEKTIGLQWVRIEIVNEYEFMCYVYPDNGS